MLSALALPLFANPAVVDFDSGDYCAAQKAAIMTDLFRNELIRSGRADIADRRNMDRIIAEMHFQMSDWANPARVKQIGQMIGADYLMTGNFDMLGSNLYMVVQMLDIETARAVYSSRMILATWEEYDWKVRGFASEFTGKLPAENIFTGTWTTDIPHDNIIDTYTITFTSANRCTVQAVRRSGNKRGRTGNLLLRRQHPQNNGGPAELKDTAYHRHPVVKRHLHRRRQPLVQYARQTKLRLFQSGTDYVHKGVAGKRDNIVIAMPLRDSHHCEAARRILSR